MTQTPETPLAALRAHFLGQDPSKIAAAVSGGSDSLALLSLLRQWNLSDGPDVLAVTVNHGLRPEASEEAALVSKRCADWGVPHHVLHWSRPTQSGNLHDQARRGRYALMADWARSEDIPVIALGHTRDDQAETFMMRLARGAGVDGLSAMRRDWSQNGISFARPLLECRREALRDHLRAQNVTWVEDRANSDPAFERSRVRAALPALGISIETLADVAARMSQAKEALHSVTLDVARRIARTEMGDVLIEAGAFKELPQDIARRLLLMSMQWISGAEYPPRGNAMTALYEDVLAARNATLQGCDISLSKGIIRLTREANAVRDLSAAPGEAWDGRWQVIGPETPKARISALGKNALQHCPDRQTCPLPARSLIATPAVWQGETLLAAPLAGLSNGWEATLIARGCDDFAAQIVH